MPDTDLLAEDAPEIPPCLTPDPEQARTCVYPEGHEGPHGWEVEAEISALANEIQMETGCPEEVAVVAAQYAMGRIQDWKRGYESAYRTAEVARSMAVDLHEAATEVVSAFDQFDLADTMILNGTVDQQEAALRQVTDAITGLRKALDLGE